MLIINGMTVIVENPKNIWYIKAFGFFGLVKCLGERSCEITGCDQTTPLSEASISRQEPLLHNIVELCTDFLEFDNISIYARVWLSVCPFPNDNLNEYGTAIAAKIPLIYNREGGVQIVCELL